MYIEFVFFFMAKRPLVGQDLLIVEASRSHSDTVHSVGSLHMSDQTNAETSKQQQATLTRLPPPRRDSNPQSQEAGDRKPKPQTARLSSLAITFYDSYNNGTYIRF
jgi:hypothetical protein